MLANALCVIWCGRVLFISGIGCGLPVHGLPVVSGCIVVNGAQ